MKKRNKATVRYTSRHQLIERMRRELEHRGYPRLQMMLLVTLTGGAGFLASYCLLHAGIDSLAWRYGLAIAIAYLVFLVLLWLWLRTSSRDYDGLEDVVPDIVDAISNHAGRAIGRSHGGGGEFGGGGASAHWEADLNSESLVELPDVPLPDLSSVADADEAALPLAVVLFVIALVLIVLFASVSIVYSAPLLFAELVVDGVLSATLYRRLQRLEPRHWLHSALRRTIVPFAITAALLMAAGWGMSIYAPGAHTLGEVIAVR